ncbi:MAG: hypothetical protein Q8K26_01140 [Candidatus Gracilibacteria bacterium]|nr:hypothetical protein [Candidatus Gracilibacteria bacterium]
MQLDYQKVQEKYQDSLSQYDIHTELTAPEKFGPLHFSGIEDIFQKMAQTIYELELFDFRNNLFPQEINKIESSRNFLIGKFNEIRSFAIGTDNGTQQKQQSIVGEIDNHYKNTFFQVDDLLFKVRTKQLLDDPKGKEIESILSDSKIQAEAIKKAGEQIDKIKVDLENTLNEAKKGTQTAGEFKAQVGSLQIGQFFKEEAEEHKINASGSVKTNYSNFFGLFDGWLGKRRIFFALIFLAIIGNIIFYIIDTVFLVDKNFFTVEYGILSLSFLLILYMGMSFATNNYSVEKQLESENKNKSTIANTLELFLSAPQTEESRGVILQNATLTLFSPPTTGTDKGKVQNLNFPITEIIKTVKGSGE